MNENSTIYVLIAEIEKHLSILDELETELVEALEKDIVLLGRSKRSAAMVASIVESYFTCAETVFVRISQFFENNLSENRWHKDLLEKMTLRIPEIRPSVLSDRVFVDLEELLRFRHFKRYYFNLSYDWERLDEIIKRAKRVHLPLSSELRAFIQFLASLPAAE